MLPSSVRINNSPSVDHKISLGRGTLFIKKYSRDIIFKIYILEFPRSAIATQSPKLSTATGSKSKSPVNSGGNQNDITSSVIAL